MKNYLKYILFLPLIGLFNSCELEEVNEDPGSALVTNNRLLLPSALAQAAYNQSAVSARLSGIVMQQYFGFDAQQLAYNDYLIGTDVFNSLWRFGLYAGSKKSLFQIIEQANETEQITYRGISKVMMAHELFHTTSMFGDIPYTQAFQFTENTLPSYDTQEEIINTVLQLLNEGIADLNATDNSGFVPSGDDRIYAGDVDKWVKFANGIRARVLINMSKRGSNMDDVLAAVNASFESNADNATFPWEDNPLNANPIGKFAIDRSGTLRGDGRFYNRLLAKDDPRAPFYMAIDVSDANDTTFNAIVRGAGLTWSELNSAMPLLSFAELKFIEAEALARKDEDAATVGPVLRAAIDASVSLVTGEAAVDSFLDARSDLTGFTKEQMIERIIDEAYDSYFGIAFQQSWNNYRRTGYPALTPNPDGVNGFNAGGVIPRRWLYPENERITNSANLDAAISAQGGHLHDNDLWIYQ